MPGPTYAKRYLDVALVQMDCVLGDVDHNLERIHREIAAHRDAADLIVFPELATTGYGIGSRFTETALHVDSAEVRALRDASTGTHVALGMSEETSSFNFYNAQVHLKDGALRHVHHKIYLPNYGIFEERKYFTPGRRYQTFEEDGWRFAPFVCGDAWNPALVHFAAAELAHVLVFSVNSPEGGMGSRISSKEGWQRLSRFYAAVYGCYVIMVNRVGTEQGVRFWGESEVIDPFGRRVVASDGDDEEVLTARLDLDEVRTARTALHTIRDEDFGFLARRLADVTEVHRTSG